jgi:hypothetical protein
MYTSGICRAITKYAFVMSPHMYRISDHEPEQDQEVLVDFETTTSETPDSDAVQDLDAEWKEVKQQEQDTDHMVVQKSSAFSFSLVAQSLSLSIGKHAVRDIPPDPWNIINIGLQTWHAP